MAGPKYASKTDEAEHAANATLRAIKRISDADREPDERIRFLGHVVPQDFAQEYEECQDIFFNRDSDDWRQRNRMVKR